MIQTKIYASIIVLACIVGYLGGKNRLTFSEKKAFFCISLAAGLVCSLIGYQVAGNVHDELHTTFNVSTDVRAQDGALGLLALFFGIAGSLGVLWIAHLWQHDRTDAALQQNEAQRLTAIAQAQAAIERARQEELARPERMQQNEIELMKLKLLAYSNAAQHARAVENLQKQEELLRAERGRFGRAHDRWGEMSEAELDEKFRRELGGGRTAKLDLGLLATSNDPFVQNLVRRKPVLPPTPDEARNPDKA